MTTDAPRRTLEELVARYQLEPQLRDVYVEGTSDKYFVEWFLQEKAERNVAVYEISTVQIAEEKVQCRGLENNNRGRVVAFAHDLEAALGQESLQVTCVADRDFDLILSQEHECNLLLFTDYACIEMYLFEENCMGRFLLTICRCPFPLSAREILTELSNVLQQLFLIRLANQLLSLGLSWMTFERCCRLTAGRVAFDVDEYITRYLNKSSMLAKKKAFVQTIDSWKPKLTSDPRYQMNGHDFVELLAWYIRRHAVDRSICRQEVVERCLFGCIGVQQLIHEPLLKCLLDRVQC